MEALRAAARDLNSREIEKNLEASLPARLASSVLSKWDDKWEILLGYRLLTPISTDDAQVALKMLDWLLRPTDPAMVVREISRCLLVTKAKEGAGADADARVAIFADELRVYPPDAVQTACREWARTNTFAPSLHDLVSLCQRFTQRRRKLKERLEMELATTKPIGGAK